MKIFEWRELMGLVVMAIAVWIDNPTCAICGAAAYLGGLIEEYHRR
jgi:energy-converting hydrogenase Eha subunit B